MDKYNKYYINILNGNYDNLPEYYKKNIRLFKLLFNKFQNKFHELDPTSFLISDYVDNCIELIDSLTPYQKELIDNNFMSFFDETTLKINSPDLIRVLLRPNDREHDYLFKMSIIVKDHLFKPSLNITTKYEPLNKLIETFNYINKTYTIYTKDANVISLLIAYSYLHDNSYEYLYNYLDNPNYYMDKIRNSGFGLDKDNHFDFHSDTSIYIYKYIKELFIRNKIIIK